METDEVKSKALPVLPPLVAEAPFRAKETALLWSPKHHFCTKETLPLLHNDFASLLDHSCPLICLLPYALCSMPYALSH